jgi:hypothetical protein
MSKANEVGVTLAKCSLAWATACFRPNPIRPDLLKTSRSIHLVKMLASQIRGARAYGETEERLYLLDGWREAPTYSARERAALAWTKALTLVAQTRAPDAGPRRYESIIGPPQQEPLRRFASKNLWRCFLAENRRH